jgi:rod shape-determining protein MreC
VPDPAARRRRHILLAVLVIVCLILITAGFGAASGGGAAGGPLGALGEGASRIAKPARDLVHWVGDTIEAKGEVQDLRDEAAELRRRNVELQSTIRRLPKEAQLQKLIADRQLERNDPVAADVINHSLTAWATTITIDRGSNDGVEIDHAVVGASGEGSGLVGFVTDVKPGLSTVSLLPTPGLAIGARLEGKDPILTVQGAGAGTSSELELLGVPSRIEIPRGALVSTSGTVPGADDEFISKAPPDLPIGRINRLPTAAGTDEQVGHLEPLVDLQTLESVVVLTRIVNGNRRTSGSRKP